MHIAILADIHGNLPALEAVLRDVKRYSVDGTIVAGDFTGGPQPQETINMLRSMGSWMIRGNGENYLLEYDSGEAPEAWRESHQWASMRWAYESLDEETLGFIATLPEQRVIEVGETDPIRVVHGSPRCPNEHLLPDRDPETLAVFREARLLPLGREPISLEVVLSDVEESVVVCGHSHIPWKQEQGGKLVVNPGSVGAPNNGDARAQYALLNWLDADWNVTHRAIEYDLALVRAAYMESGYLAQGGAFARACLMGIETGQNVPGAFVSYIIRLAAEAGLEGSEGVPDSVWAHAVATFDWTAS